MSYVSMVANYVKGTDSYTVMKHNNQLFRVECRKNGVLVSDVPFLTESDAKSYAESHTASGAQLLNESN